MENSAMWYASLYRRHLCDMHIDDWSDEFLSRFSPEEYVENLLAAKIQVAMVYCQSHVGLCYWPTATGVMHRAFQNDPLKMKRLVDLCHAHGIRVMNYYSLIYNTREHDRHPEWRHLRADGRSNREANQDSMAQDADSFASRSRYGHCCPNQPGYRTFVAAQIDEAIAFFRPDGMFFDMPFWPGTSCHCKECSRRYREETGHELPDETLLDPHSEAFRELISVKYRWMGEFVQFVTDHVKSIDPALVVEHNFAQGVAGTRRCGCGEEVAAACDYVGGDLYGDLYVQSFTCKFMRAMSPHQPFEYMFSRCKPGLRMHTLTKTLPQMKTALAVTMSHHGATLVIDAIDPVGTMDKRLYRQLGELFSYEEPYEPYFTGVPRQDVGILYGIRSRNISQSDTVNSKSGSIGALKALIKHHVPCGVVGNQPLDSFKCILAPMLSNCERDNARLADHVRNGGALYLSGAEDPALLRELTGGTVTGTTDYGMVYLSPAAGLEDVFRSFNAQYPLPCEYPAPIVTPAPGTEVLATLTVPYTKKADPRFASIHCDPPGQATDIPALTLTRYGKGIVLWSAVPLETEPFEEYGDVLWNLVRRYLNVKPSLRSDAPGCVEITVYDTDDAALLNCTVLDEQNEPLPVFPFSVEVNVRKAPRAVTLLPGGEPIAFTYENGAVSFTTRPLRIFDMYRIEY